MPGPSRTPCIHAHMHTRALRDARDNRDDTPVATFGTSEISRTIKTRSTTESDFTGCDERRRGATLAKRTMPRGSHDCSPSEWRPGATWLKERSATGFARVKPGKECASLPPPCTTERRNIVELNTDSKYRVLRVIIYHNVSRDVIEFI